MKKMNTLLAAAIAGIMGTVLTTSSSHAMGKKPAKDAEVKSDSHSCKGMDASKGDSASCKGEKAKGANECKGKGGCKTDKHACKGQNECKGQGGCA